MRAGLAERNGGLRPGAGALSFQPACLGFFSGLIRSASCSAFLGGPWCLWLLGHRPKPTGISMF